MDRGGSAKLQFTHFSKTVVKPRHPSKLQRDWAAFFLAIKLSFTHAQVAAGSMPLYAGLPALLEAAVEAGWTRAYSRVGDVGIAWCGHSSC